MSEILDRLFGYEEKDLVNRTDALLAHSRAFGISVLLDSPTEASVNWSELKNYANPDLKSTDARFETRLSDLNQYKDISTRQELLLMSVPHVFRWDVVDKESAVSIGGISEALQNYDEFDSIQRVYKKLGTLIVMLYKKYPDRRTNFFYRSLNMYAFSKSFAANQRRKMTIIACELENS